MLEPTVSGAQSNPPGGRLLGPEATPSELAGELKEALSAAELAKSAEEQRLKSLHKRLYDFYSEEQRRQSANRFQMAIDEDYFDALQWDEEEILQLASRNQAALVYQAIKPMVLWILGTEKRTRTDYKILPRRDEAELDGSALKAEQKTKVMKYVDDVNMAQFTKSQAFKEAVVSGIGWLEDGASNNPGELPLYAGQESWKNILHDSYGNDLFGKDWRYIFRFRDLDEDVAKAMFPKHAAHIELMCSDAHKTVGEESGWYLGEKRDSADWKNPAQTYVGRRQFIDISASTHSVRRRCRVIEAWYRVPQQCYVCKGEIFDGKTFDPKNPTMKQAYEQGAIMLVNQVQMKMRVAFMTDQQILEDKASPYKHDEFPFTPVWCYRRGRDGMPYGVTRELRDPQDSLNRHMSKTQWLLASNQIVAHASAAKNWKRVRQQADKPNGTVLFDGDRETAGQAKINRHQGEIEPHVRLAEFDLQTMRENYGLNNDNFGQQGNATSGRAIIARQEQGTIMTETIFDNLRLAQQLRGRKRLSLTEQYIVEERVVRVAGQKRGQYEYLTINKPVQGPDGQWRYENDITASQADFVIDEQDYRASIRQAMAETMAEMLTKMPGEIAFRFLDMWVELLDIPNKEEYIRRVRQLNGMGEDGDPGNAEAEQVKQQAQQAIQAAQQQAEKMVAEAQAKAKQAEERAAALTEANSRAHAVIDRQALQLADRARELTLKENEAARRHDEEIRRIEAEREQKLAEVNGAAAEQARAEARTKKAGPAAGNLEQRIKELAGEHIAAIEAEAEAQRQAAEKKRAEDGHKAIEEELADVETAIEEVRQQAASIAEKVQEVAETVSQVAATPAPVKSGKKIINFVEDGNGNITGATVEEEHE